MSLDERVREGLRASAARGGLDADDVLADVQVRSYAASGAGALRAGPLSWWSCIALFAGVASLVSLRATHDSSSSGISSLPVDRCRPRRCCSRLDADDLGSSPSRPDEPDNLFALAPATREAALASAHIASGAGVEFHASLDRSGDILSLTTITPSAGGPRR